MKSYTDIEQSKKLAEILPSDSADMARCGGENVIMTDYISAKKKFSVCGELTITPCWSLAALIEVLPKIYLLKPILDLEENSIMYSGTYIDVTADNPVDACVDMIIKLKESNLLNLK